MAKDPAARPQHAGALSNELGAILHHDYGVATAALLRVVHPYGGYEERGLMPGSHRIGTGAECELQLPPADGLDRVAAMLEWVGGVHAPEVRPMGQGVVRIDGRPVAERTSIQPGEVVHVGPYRLEIHLPQWR